MPPKSKPSESAKKKPRKRSLASRLWGVLAWGCLLGVAISWIGTDRFWIATLIGAFPVMGWLVLGALCLLAIPKFRWKGWGLWTPLWLGLCLLTALPGTLTPSNPDELVLRVMTWNIDHIGGNVADYAAVIRKADPDVVCLQEASDRDSYRFNSLRKLVDGLPGYQLAMEGDNAILTKLRVEEIERFEVPMDHYRRFIPVLKISTPLGPVTIANIHLVQGFWPGWLYAPGKLDRRMTASQGARERQLEFALGHLRKQSGAKVLAGDFNMQPFGALQQRLDRDLNDASAVSALQHTFPTPLPLYRIDRVWSSSDLPPVRREVIRTNLSSHQPVVVDMKVR